MRSKLKWRRRPGFTLVELLIVVSIIAILSSLMLVVLRGARDDAAASRTARTVDRIKILLKQRLESIAARPLPFVLKSFPDTLTWEQARYLRNRHLMESVRAEMPTNYEMVAQFPSSQSQDPTPGAANAPNLWTLDNATYYRDLLQARPPAALIAHRQILFPVGDNVVAAEVPGLSALEPFPIRENPQLPVLPKPPGTLYDNALIEGSECLYSILYNLIDKGSRGTQILAPGEIGDTDGDGRLEVLDAWGQPLYFSIVINRFDNAGTPIDRNGDGDTSSALGHLDGQLDSDFPAELAQYRIVVFSVRGSTY